LKECANVFCANLFLVVITQFWWVPGRKIRIKVQMAGIQGHKSAGCRQEADFAALKNGLQSASHRVNSSKLPARA
jgi:hypothetical protein